MKNGDVRKRCLSFKKTVWATGNFTKKGHSRLDPYPDWRPSSAFYHLHLYIKNLAPGPLSKNQSRPLHFTSVLLLSSILLRKVLKVLKVPWTWILGKKGGCRLVRRGTTKDMMSDGGCFDVLHRLRTPRRVAGAGTYDRTSSAVQFCGVCQRIQSFSGWASCCTCRCDPLGTRLRNYACIYHFVGNCTLLKANWAVWKWIHWTNTFQFGKYTFQMKLNSL